MTLTHLNKKFLQSNPYEANPYGTALVKTIREKLLLPGKTQIDVEENTFEWLLEMTDSTPTASTLGNNFIRITSGDGESFVDVIQFNQVLNVEATKNN